MYKGLYQRQKVRSLRDCAFKTIGVALVDTLERVKSNSNIHKIVLDIKRYFNAVIGTTSPINEQLLRTISNSSIEYTVAILCLKILLNKSVTKFDTYVLYNFTDRRLWKTLLDQSEKLQEFSLQFTPMTVYLDLYTKILRKNPNIKVLAPPLDSDDETLDAIAENCLKLQYFHSSAYIGERKMVEFFTKGSFAKNLMEVQMSIIQCEESGVTACMLVVKLLRCCPKIEKLKHYSFMSKALFVCQGDKDFKCNLKCVRDSYTSKDSMQIIVDTCPKLKALALVSPSPDALQALYNTPLQRLIVQRFVSSELMSLLERTGQHLRNLVICDGDASIDLAEVARLCTTLVEFEVHHTRELHFTKSNFRFQCLENITVRRSTLTDEVMKELFCSASTLKYLRIDKLYINDHFLEEIFNAGDFRNLEEFYAHRAPKLTVASVYMLLLKCPSLRKLGPFINWDVTAQDVRSIKILEMCPKFDIFFSSPPTAIQSTESERFPYDLPSTESAINKDVFSKVFDGSYDNTIFLSYEIQAVFLQKYLKG